MSINNADLTSHNRVILAAIIGLVCCVTIYTLWFGNISLAFAVSRSEWVLANRDLIKTVAEFGKNSFYVLFIAMLLYGLWRKKRHFVDIFLAYLMSQAIGAAAIVRSLKILTGHARPDEIFASGLFEDIWIGPTMDSAFHSFPSGHTAELFTSAIFASFLVKKLWQKGLILSFAVFMGFSRIALAKHFPYDVIGGAVIGTGASFLIGHYWLFPRLRLIDRDKADMEAPQKQ